MPGVPASLTRAIVAPLRMRATNSGVRSSSLCSCRDTIGVWMPKCFKSTPVCRVSSAAIKELVRNVSHARALKSPRLPIGVATT